ncbi:lantibiotic dehydratase [Pedobacter caeni]|uniref:Lantibiotic dehydratase, C terminus n=1 Tax=Pedobacter caeni TaxID=288992 RepID=A0A1M5HFF0_9SPHI|nr:lantibiotic dehydratase [Pedobacter caeni]SHG14673.1 Lantibiotic dehydratase, C terminus [Pedobacter caeni]
MSIQIFPHSLVRYAGMDYRTFDDFKLKGAAEILQKHQYILREKARLKLLICDGLYDLITAQTTDENRQILINLKRQIYNDKKIAIQKLDESMGLFPDALALELKSYLFLEQSIANFHNANRTNFQRQLIGQYRKLQQLAFAPSLQNGLLLSSPVLLEQLSGYQNREPEAFRQKEHRISFSLLRYLTRMCFKTSPFSTFTYTGIMQLSGKQPRKQELFSKAIHHKIRLNNKLFEYLKSVLVHHPRINELMTVRLNETATIKAEKIHFLINFNNIESFQQLPAIGLQLLIFHYLRKEKQTPTLVQLIDKVSESVEDASADIIKSYLFKLISAGLLELSMETSGINPKWDEELLKFLLKTTPQDADTQQLIGLFEQLQQYKSSYSKGNTAERNSILQAAEHQLDTVLKALEHSAGLASPQKGMDQVSESNPNAAFEILNFKSYRFSGRQLFYEDCYTTESEFLEKALITDFTKKADQLLSHLSPMDLLKTERQKMTSFFREHYPENTKVKVADFYHAYYFHIKKPEKENTATLSAKNSGEWVTAVNLKLAELTLNKPDSIHLDHLFFEPLSTGKMAENQYSKALFVQFYLKKQDAREESQNAVFGVINSVLPGMGKVSGRFLPLFSPELSTDFLRYNSQLHPEILKAEINDASSFNANIHPSLLDHELALPGGNKSYPENQQIQIDDLLISFNEKTNFLKLSYREKDIYTYDLCLESFYNRSNLYQLMAHFNEEEKVFLPQFISLVDAHYLEPEEEQVEEILSLPRITYEKTVIIRRKTWRIKTDSIPVQQPSEPDYDYFIRINDWRLGHELPVNIFLFLRKKTFFIKPSLQKNAKKEGFNDDYKPQFISFEQPLLIELFKRLLARAGDYVVVEEMLPELPTESQSEPVKEYLLHWYKY